MINVFFQDYFCRLRSWADLRSGLEAETDIQKIVTAIDDYWQKAPITPHNLHPDEVEQWPDPWVLLSDNDYCHYGRALGMIYTLFLLGIKDVKLHDAIDEDDEEQVIVIVNDNFVLNSHPNSVDKCTPTDFKIRTTIDLTSIYNKI